MYDCTIVINYTGICNMGGIRISGISIVVRFVGISTIGKMYAIYCHYPENELVSIKVSRSLLTRFDKDEFTSLLLNNNVREYDTINISADVRNGMYGTLIASNLSLDSVDSK